MWCERRHRCGQHLVVDAGDAGEKGGRLRRPKSHGGQFLVSSGGPSKILSNARIRTDQSIQPLK